jgi:hypothetical protein
MGSVEWIQLAQDRYRWRALVNTVMKLLGSVPKELVTKLVRERLTVYSENNTKPLNIYEKKFRDSEN